MPLCKQQRQKFRPVHPSFYQLIIAEESKQIVSDLTAPRGAVRSGTILFAHAFPVVGDLVVTQRVKI